MAQKKFCWCQSAVVLLAQGPIVANGDSQHTAVDVRLAERFIDAFYSWRAENLQRFMASNAYTKWALCYQGWAQATNYTVLLRRPCQILEDEVVCTISVPDDFGSVLGYRATDTFRIQVADRCITKIAFAVNDPPIFSAILEWLAQQRPEILTGPCYKMVAGGLAPVQSPKARGTLCRCPRFARISLS